MSEVINLCGHYIIVGIVYAIVITFPFIIIFRFLPFSFFSPFQFLIPTKLQIWWLTMNAEKDGINARLTADKADRLDCEKIEPHTARG